MNLNIWQTLLLALLQGVTELFPISSLGHSAIVPGLFPHFFPPFATDTSCGGRSCFLPLVTALHLGTSIALVLYFWRDWLQVIGAIWNSLKQAKVEKGTQEWVSWLIVIGCIPGALLGVALKDPLTRLFSSPVLAAAFLVVNGGVLLVGEVLRRRRQRQAVAVPLRRQGGGADQSVHQSGEGHGLAIDQQATLTLPRLAAGHLAEPSSGSGSVLTATSRYAAPNPETTQVRELSSLSWKEALLVGLAQAAALIPGISRSGASMVAGLGVGLSHEDAARYSFLLGTPLIAGAALLEVPDLFGLPLATLGMVLLGMAVAGVAAFLSTKFLLRYFETGRLHPFAYYCWGVGLLSLILLLTLR
jgi:undecaprenyl-diphosphatase